MLKKILQITILSLIVLSVFTGQALARETRSTQVVVLDPPEGEVKNFYIIRGENIEIRGQVNGDVYAFAGIINVIGKINGDLIAIGQDVNISGEVSDDARIIAQNTKLSGKVGKNLTTIAEMSAIEGQGLVAGGISSLSKELNIAGRVVGQISAGAKEVFLENSVGGPIELWVETLSIGNSASIQDKLNYHSDKDAIVSPSANLAGEITRTTLPQFEKKESFRDKMNLPFKVISFLGALVVGYIFLRLFPKFNNHVLEVVNSHFLRSFLIGLMLLVLLPILSILTFITIIGMPLSVLNLVVYFVLLYLAKLFAALWIGRKVLPGKKDVWGLTVGLFIIYFVSIVPFLGGLLTAIARLVGFGALYLTLKEYLWKPSRK